MLRDSDSETYYSSTDPYKSAGSRSVSDLSYVKPGRDTGNHHTSGSASGSKTSKTGSTGSFDKVEGPSHSEIKVQAFKSQAVAGPAREDRIKQSQDCA